MKTFQLKGEIRQDLGKKASKTFRKEGNVPCVLYGGNETVHFTVKEADIFKLIYSPNVYIVELELAGKTVNTIVKELQFHPVTDKTIHIDFLEIFEDKPVVVEIPVQLEGFAAGVRAGGKLTLDMRKLRVKGLYSDFPERIIVDVTKLKLGSSIQVGDLSLDKLELMNAKNAVVAKVQLTRVARGAAAAAGLDDDEDDVDSEETSVETE